MTAVVVGASRLGAGSRRPRPGTTPCASIAACGALELEGDPQAFGRRR